MVVNNVGNGECITSMRQVNGQKHAKRKSRKGDIEGIKAKKKAEAEKEGRAPADSKEN